MEPLQDHPIILAAVAAIGTGILGFLFGSYRQFREEKHRAYRELLPPIIKAAYRRDLGDEKELNEATAKLWLYANRSVAKKMDLALSRIIKPSRGSATQALQEAIIAMRKDLRLRWFWQGLSSKEVAHIYTVIGISQTKSSPKQSAENEMEI